MPRPTSRSAKREATAQRILDAARAEFGEYGLERTTVRAIAQRAGIDPSLVIQHYGTKAELFAAAVQLPVDDDYADPAEHLFSVLDHRVEGLTPEIQALMRSMLTAPEATEVMRLYLGERVRKLAEVVDEDDAELKAALIVSSILGLTVARHLLKLDPLARMTPEQIEATVRPWIRTMLEGQASGQRP